MSQLLEGSYEIKLVAARGSRKGAIASGRLTLLRAPAAHWMGSNLYGYTDLDFDDVGAPLLGEGAPVPSSRDPEAPGVLVASSEDGVPILLVGTTANRDPGGTTLPNGLKLLTLSSDGSGIGLRVHEASEQGILGRWSEWGLVRDGGGTFCAQRRP